MYIIDNKLAERARIKNPIRIGIIGAGEMGKGLINQVYRYFPGIQIVVVYNRTLEKVQNAMVVAGITNYTIVKNNHELENAEYKGEIAVTTDVNLAIETERVEVLIELTGQISFGLEVTLNAFKHGKHLVSFNAELEATFGPLIKQKAAECGVKYTLGDGDQPGCTLNLYRQVKAMGFTPLVCGNIKSIQDHYRTPATQAGFAEEWGMNPVMATNFVDGTKISLEQACIANATNMVVSQRGMKGYRYDGIIDDVVKMFDVEMLEELGGVVDYALGATPKPGVFVFATANDPFSGKYLTYGKLGEGPLYSFYVPYHLLFFELVFSIARLIDFDDVTLNAQYGMKVEVGSFAKNDLDTGTKLDGIGGFHVYGLCENHDIMQREKLLPIGLSKDMVLKRKIKKDQPITFNDVEFQTHESLIHYYNKQLEFIK